jgi:D-amino-acid oxidase
MPSHHIVIIGGGVTGLTTACELLQRNYQVTVIAERYANQDNRITSQVAGALWEWPPAVCGRHTDIISLENSKRWCKVAYDRYKEMAAKPELSLASGVRMRMAKFFFLAPVLSCAHQVSFVVINSRRNTDFSLDYQDARD